jgi:hypothetical protein
MKATLLIGILLMTLSLRDYAQAPQPAAKPFEFADVAIADSLDKDVLFQNAKKWVALLELNNESVFQLQPDSMNGKLSGKSTFYVFSQSGILKKISGKVSYNFSVEVKDKKYRYSFTDFVFHYFKQDRYYNMVETGKTKPLEEVEAQGWQKLWTTHRKYVTVKMNDNVKLLQVQMKENPKKIEKIIAAKKIEW